MGINISAHLYLGVETDNSPCGPPVEYAKTEPQDWFDYIRHSGDKDFVNDLEWVNINEAKDDDYEHGCFRLKDIDHAFEWVSGKIVSGNRARLLTLLEKMKADPRICIKISR